MFVYVVFETEFPEPPSVEHVFYHEKKALAWAKHRADEYITSMAKAIGIEENAYVTDELQEASGNLQITISLDDRIVMRVDVQSCMVEFE